MPVEIELKLAIASGDVARLRRHPLLKGVKSTTRRLYGIYFDTPKFELFHRRGAIRLRREGYHWVQTVKLDSQVSGGLSTRPEWEVRVTGNRPDFQVLPAEARECVDADLLERLAPLFVTDFRRTTWLLEFPGGTVEVAIDQGHIRPGLDEPAQSGKPGRAIKAHHGAPTHDPVGEMAVSEVELELKAGDPEVLFDVALAMLESVPMLPEFRSKALRGYILAGVHQPAPSKAVDVAIEPHLPATEAWRRMLLAALTQFSRNLPGFLDGQDPEYLHQMRVAVRRMSTLLSLGDEFVEAPAHWRDELRWLMGELSPARDWDVMETQTLAMVYAGLPEPHRLDDLIMVARDRRSQANQRAREAVLDRRCAHLLLDIGRALLTVRETGPELAEWARSVLDKRWRRFRKLGRQFADLKAAERHRLRIAAKRLRYAGEIFAPLRGKQASLFLKSLAGVQDRLGVANDAAVAHALLNSLDSDGSLERAIGLVDGYLASQTTGGMRKMAKLVANMAAEKPFWR